MRCCIRDKDIVVTINGDSVGKGWLEDTFAPRLEVNTVPVVDIQWILAARVDKNPICRIARYSGDPSLVISIGKTALIMVVVICMCSLSKWHFGSP